MPLDFPDSPTEGQVFTDGKTTWTWEAPRWIGATTIEGPPGPQGPPGPTETDEGPYPF